MVVLVAGPAVQLGVGYLSIAAEGSEIARTIGRELSKVENAATKTGKKIGEALQSGAEMDLDDAKRELENLKDAAEKTSKGVQAAMHKQSMATSLVTQRTKELESATAKYGRESAQVIGKERALAEAKFKLSAETQKAVVAQKAHEQSLEAVERATAATTRETNQAQNAVSRLGQALLSRLGLGSKVASAAVDEVGDQASQTSRKVKGLTFDLARFHAVAMGVKTLAIISGVTALGAAVVAALPAVGALTGAVVPLMGVAAAAVPGLAVLALAAKDAGARLGHLAPQFEALQKRVSGNFWAPLIQPISGFVNRWMPQVSDGMAKVASASGGFWKQVISYTDAAIKQAGGFKPLFDTAAQAIQTLAPAAGMFVSALIRIGSEGLKYVQPLAEYFDQLGTKFWVFIDAAADSGALSNFVAGGVAAFKSLLDVLGAAGGAIAALARGAAGIGSTGLFNLLTDLLASLTPGFESLGRILADSFPVIRQMLLIVADGLSIALGALAPVVAAVMPYLNSFFGFISNHLPTIVAVTAAIGGLVLGIKAISGAMSLFSGAIGVAKMLPGLLASGLGILTSPITLVVIGVTALIAGLVLLYKKSETFRNMVNGLGSALMSGFKGALDVILPPLQALGARITELAQRAMPMITQIGQFLVEKFQQAVPVLQNVFNTIAIVVKFAFDIVAGIIAFALNMIRGGIELFANVVKFIWDHFGTYILNAVSIIWNTILGVINGVMNFIQGIIRTIMAVISGDWSGAWEGIKLAFSGIWQVIVSLLSGFVSMIWNNITAFVTAVGIAWSAFWSGVWLKVVEFVNAIITTVVNWVLRMIFEVNLFIFKVRLAWDLFWLALHVKVMEIANAIITTVVNWVLRIIFEVNLFIFKVQFAWDSFWWNLRTKADEFLGLIRGGIDRFFDGVRNAFQTGVDAIGRIWDGIKDKTKAPVDFVVNTVYNKGLRGIWNPVAKIVNLPELPDIKGFSTGGYTGPGSRLQPAGIVHADEFVVRKAARQRFERSNPGFLDHINRTGRMPGYAVGGRVHPVPGWGVNWGRGYHGVDRGLDIPAPKGTPVVAMRDSVVNSTAKLGTSYGWHVRTSDGAVYAHLSRIDVSPGMRLAAGQQLGLVGSSGNSTGPHLHVTAYDGAAAVGAAGAVQPAFDFFGKVGELITKPLEGMKSRFGDSPFVDAVTKMPGILVDKAKSFLTEKLSAVTDFIGLSGATANGNMDANARLLMQAGKSIGLPRREMRIALMTAAVESTMGTDRKAMYQINGDGDVGWFQQRATRGDGTVAQLADPLFGLRTFIYGAPKAWGLYNIPRRYAPNGWQALSDGAAAQAVQVSAFPSKYARWGGQADKWLGMFGYASGGHVTGWTGPGSMYQAAGVVHADEFVVRKAARRSIERSNPGALDYMNRTGVMPGSSGVYAPISVTTNDPMAVVHEVGRELDWRLG